MLVKGLPGYQFSDDSHPHSTMQEDPNASDQEFISDMPIFENEAFDASGHEVNNPGA